MTDDLRNNGRTLKNFLRTYRLYVWVAAVIVTYAVLGFFLAPWLVHKNMVETVRETYDAELSIEKVEINPFVLSLRMTEFALDDPTGAPAVRIEGFFANFQLSSLFRRALTFDELRITEPEFFVARDASGNLNFAYLVEGGSEEPQQSDNAEDEEASPVPLLIFEFAIDNLAVNWRDEVPEELVETRFAPINIEIQELNTLPQRSGKQKVVITTETQGTLSWEGDLQLNPLKSSAHASIKGSYFPLTSAYIRYETGFEIVDGNADVELDYAVNTREDGTLDAAIDNFNLVFNDVVVHTFSGPDTADRQILQLPEVRLAGGELRWPEQTLSLESLTIDDSSVNLHRDESGELNVSKAPPGATSKPAEEPEEQSAATNESEWKVSLGNLAINRLSLQLEDDSVAPTAELAINEFNLSVSDISNELSARFPTNLSLALATGGGLTMEGDVAVLPEALFDFDLNIDGIVLAVAHPYIEPLANVNMDSGSLNVDGKLSHSPEEPLLFNGDVEIRNLDITETNEGTRLGSWGSMRAEKIAMSVADEKLEISEIHFDQPYGDIVIGADGSLNIGRVEKTASDTDTPATQEEGSESTFAVTIGRIIVENAAADFADESLPLPFSAKIEELSGDISTISTASNEPSSVELEGKVDDAGFVRVAGSVTPLDPTANTDIGVSFKNVNMPKFTAYSIPFAGREIASGGLDLDLGYQVNERKLVGENKIILRDFELGDEVPHPDAMSLPLGLAVALLKDTEGKIDIDLPVSGDLDDPEFSYGGVVMKALGNLIVKIVASPFLLLGNLVGMEPSELENINFMPGRSDLTPPEMERASKLAEALAQRPGLALKIAGVMDADVDGLAIKTEVIEALVEERTADLADSNDEGMYAEHRRSVLEDMFGEQQLADDPDVALEELRAQFTTQADDEDAEPQFDELAYVNEVQRQLIEAHTVTDEQLTTLATERAENTQAAVLASNASLATQIVIEESKTVTMESDDQIQMKVVISASP